MLLHERLDDLADAMPHVADKVEIGWTLVLEKLKLRRQDGKPLLVIGSTELAAALLAHDLVDELRLMIDPVVLGGGKRFFRDDGVCRRLTLAASETTSTGAILATYARSSGDTPVGASAVPLPRPPRGRS